MTTFGNIITIGFVLFAVCDLNHTDVSIDTTSPNVYATKLKEIHLNAFTKLVTYICDTKKADCPAHMDAMKKQQSTKLDKIITPQTVCDYKVQCVNGQVTNDVGKYPYCFNCLFSTPWTKLKTDSINHAIDYFCQSHKGLMENGYCHMSYKSMIRYQHMLIEFGGHTDLCQRMDFCPENPFQKPIDMASKPPLRPNDVNEL